MNTEASGVRSIVNVLRTIDPGQPSRSLLSFGHYASVLRITCDIAIALAVDGVGSKLIVAEQTGRLDTVGIDCVAMNVNDLVCVGAKPIAMLDYIAVTRSDPAALAQIAEGLKAGAELAGIEIPGGELAILPELGFDLCGAAFGTVAPDAIVTGDAIAPGDALVGLPSSGLHSNGYTLARRVLSVASHADELLRPTTIYVRAMLELLASGVDVRGLAHITGGGLSNLLRLNSAVGFAIEQPLPVPAIFGLIARLGSVPSAVMWETFNMGCGFVAIVPDAQADDAVALLAVHHPGSARIGTVTERAGQCSISGGMET